MISHEFQGTLLKVGEQKCQIPTNITLTFDEEYDPIAVQMVIRADGAQEDVVWVFSRELLTRGVTSVTPVGQGDVKFKYFASGSLMRVVVCLRNASGHADLALPAERVIAFLNDANTVIRLGEEHFDDLIDEFINEVLEEGA